MLSLEEKEKTILGMKLQENGVLKRSKDTVY